MKILQLAVATFAISSAVTAAADTVNPADVTTFQSGSPALAAEVNTTLQALITAIDDNAARIADLEADATSTDAPSPEGSIYCLIGLASAVGASDPDPTTGDGTWIGAAQGYVVEELFFGPSDVTFTIVEDAFQEVVAPSYRREESSDPVGETETAGWTLLGNTLTIDFGMGDIITMWMSPDGNMLLNGGYEFDRSYDNTGDWAESEIAIAVRSASCN